MAQRLSLEEALGGAPKIAAAPPKRLSLDDALGVRQKDVGLPAGEDLAALITPPEDQPKTERKVYTGSVFDTQPFDPKFNPEEAARLSRRDYAEREAQKPRRTQSMRATPAEQIERTVGQAIADTGIGLLQGAAGIPKGIAANINAGDNPVAKFYEEAIQAGERAKSPFLQSQKAEREALLKNVLQNQGELAQTRAAFTSMFSPSGADVVAQGTGSMLPTVGMSLLNLGQRAFVATNALANAGEAAQNTARELSQMSPQDWSNSDAYQDLRGAGLSHADAVRMLAPLFAMPSQLVGGVAGGLSGATGLEKSLAGKGITGGARERGARAGAELLGEQVETLAPSFAGNVTQRMLDEEKSLTEGLGREAVETLFGATPGAALAATGRSGTEAPRELDIRGLADRMARERGFLTPTTRAERPEPVERPAPVREKVEPTFDEEAFVAPTPKVEEDLTQQRAQEQADVLALEGEAMTAKPEAVTEETPQEKLSRLSSKSIGMTNAFRDRVITNQEYDNFKSDLEAARQAVNQEATDVSALSPAKQEILDIADKLEAAGVKGVADGMRLAARPRAPEPNENNMEFYRSKLQPYEEVKTVAEKAPYGLPEFFSDNEKEAARITGLMKSGPLKARVALSEANDSIQRLADTIQAAGFDINNLVESQVPDGIMKIKRQIGNIAARSNRLAAATEAVQKKYKRADPARVKSDAAELMADVEEADNLLAEDQNLPSAAEQMEGAAPPVSPEVEELMKKQRLAAEDIDILSKRTSGTSLMKVLEGSLKDGEMSELAGKARKIGKNPFISLVAKKGKRGSSMEDMVESGKLNLFLPFGKRSGEPGYDNAESAEYIREKLRTGEFYTDEIRQEIEDIQRGIWDIEAEINEELSLEDINREIQYAVDEQRAIDQEAAPAPTEGAFEALEEGAGAKAEEDLIDTPAEEAAPIEDKKVRDRLMQIAKNLGVQVFETDDRPMAGGGFISIPFEDKETEGAVTPEHVFAHELGHAIMQNKGMAFNKMPKDQVEKWIPGFASLKEISKKFRPAIWSHKLPKVRRHANKNDEIIADALGSYLLGESSKTDIAPLIKGIGLNEYDLGEKKFDYVAEQERLIADLNEKQKQREEQELLKSQTEEELRAKQDEVDRLDKENKRLAKEAEDKAKADEEAGDFVLTGSKRDVDEAEARGQQTFLNISPATGPGTAAFKRWFGGSKVVDENGDPMVVYHKTKADIQAFDKDKIGGSDFGYAGRGFYFMPFPLQGDTYGNITMPVFLSLQNPFVIDDSNWKSEEGPYRWISANSERLGGLKEASIAWTEMMKSRGFDGFMDKTGKGDGEIVAFEPTQIKSAIGNIGTYDPENPSILRNISKTPVTGEPAKRAPSVTRRAKTLSRAREQGKISDMEFVIGVNGAIEAAENAKMQKDRPERQRGADFIRQKLLEAKRRGDLSEEASDLAEWFILNNPALVDDLGISIRMKKAEGTAGQYIPFSRIMVLMKGAANDQTPVHEILHHLERMMPADVQSAIRKEWAKQLTQAKQKAATPDERKFFELLFRHHYHENGSKNDFDKAVGLIQDGKAPYEFYQYVNPSEFWAVNGSDIMQGRFDAVRGGLLSRLKNWLKELGQKAKSIFGIPSDACLLYTSPSPRDRQKSRMPSSA